MLKDTKEDSEIMESLELLEKTRDTANAQQEQREGLRNNEVYCANVFFSTRKSLVEQSFYRLFIFYNYHSFASVNQHSCQRACFAVNSRVRYGFR